MIKDIEDKIPYIANFATKTALNAKIKEVQGEIPDITNLTTTTSLTAAENELPSVSNLVKQTEYNTTLDEIEKKITDHNQDKYITTPEFNGLTSGNFTTRLRQSNLAGKSDIDNFVKKTDFDNKLSFNNN